MKINADKSITKSLIEKVLEHYGSYREGDVRIAYSITTNGSLLDKDMAELFKHHNVTVTISYDSHQDDSRLTADGRQGEGDSRNRILAYVI